MNNFLRYAWPTSQNLSPVEAHPAAGHQKVHHKQKNGHRRGVPPLSEIVTQFILLCNNASTKTQGEKPRRITARLLMQAALEELPLPERSPESLDQQLLKAVENLNAALTRQLGIDMANYWSPPGGISLATQVETFSREMPLPRLQDAIVDFVSGLIEGLEAPVLVQLERGQLQGLNRAETQQLKDRVGLR
ncbi:hypothetical protein P170DRAFT_85837 [Aspergillus steynii IBT 23096]|uniref:Uncharacterized protein n=1 Tax=Aspergillus steynii IBT 23096 TaxID=1392250 RepID=A0A2I2GFW1_9EURO|nr:uncharacterized protein P170DRAFT_85837 [Aspergillus steynii IBT 23096]PLB51759.1 hypothetical protein P170DRAFT_85837 [Aspergillus steynii IBT 23096]